MFEFLSQKLSSAFSWLNGKSKISSEDIASSCEQVKVSLIEADVPLDIVNELVATISAAVVGLKPQKGLTAGQQFIKAVHTALTDFLGGASTQTFSVTFPSTIMVMGLQGAGKTTAIAKLARYFLKEAEQKGKKRRILCASVDYYRPAAREQLKIMATSVGASYYESLLQDPVAAAQDIAHYAKKNSFELVFLDTAGRLHVDESMIQELKKIDTLVAPKHKLLVVDAMIGQESLAVARAFSDSIGFEGALLTKMDSGTRGGVALAFRYSLKKPIYFIGDGEKVADLQKFVPERVASVVLGLGDVLTVIEKIESEVSKNEQEHAMRRLMSKDFNLNDFGAQLGMVDRMGSMTSMLKYLPGMGTVSQEHIDQGIKEMKRMGAIISSMTSKERSYPRLLDASRKNRIASGAGVAVADVNQLLQKFEKTKQLATMFGKVGGFKGVFR